MARSIDDLLAEVRSGMVRLRPCEAAVRAAAGALLVDTRFAAQRREHGAVPGAVAIERNHLEWRLDPASPDRIPQAVDHDVEVILICQEGYSTSLAAATLQALGLHRATDVIGGVDGWRDAGLALLPAPDA